MDIFTYADAQKVLQDEEYTFKENGEANYWVIMYKGNWFMTVRFNGEMMEAAQISRLIDICLHFNGHCI